VCGIKDRVVAIAAIHLQLARVNRVAERHRLIGLVADVQRHRVRQQAAHRAREDGSGSARDSQNAEEGIDPARKQEPLHSINCLTIDRIAAAFYGSGRRKRRRPLPIRHAVWRSR
jgi:hypothetical protein